jgi:hypothetical protein
MARSGGVTSPRFAGRPVATDRALVLARLDRHDPDTVSADADIVEVGGDRPAEAVAALRGRHSGLVIAVRTASPADAARACAAGADLLDVTAGPGLAAVAAQHDTAAICLPGDVAGLVRAGVRPDGVLVRGGRPGEREPVLLELPDTLDAAIAVAAVAAVRGGVRVLGTRHPREVRRAVEMAAGIAGTRAPVRVLRAMV